MIALILSAALLADASAQPPSPTVKRPCSSPEKPKDERIKLVTRMIDMMQKQIDMLPAAIAREKKPAEVQRLQAILASDQDNKRNFEVELRWLKGELTTASAKQIVETTESQIKTAKDAGKPTAELDAALANAQWEQKRVAELESFEKPAAKPEEKKPPVDSDF
jgi:hypothetical protein